ncbi:hypothetical protein GA0061099_10813 [Bradyrhizobium yuanmingense]|uniref:Uncharacterized protein n=1 Tax=Bradyrhizobium yuanmingense TaxID=108015 RepID=A0A1C3XMW0_9BRAD|nr:hypothetical protein IQ15_07822 [Bradyrhizobium yuanmingense]SCB53603.1 hypothetical protein GA0061099_10813 [Bradyrhizobium yuanmingense]
MRSTGAETPVLGTKALQWHWTEGALSSGFTRSTTRKGMIGMSKAKPFCIAKRDVWEAYKHVKANQGAAGVDGQSIEDFDRDLSKNLYRIWNRMSSGSYFPPPVRRVDIPKGGAGSTRPLGIPTASDRILQDRCRCACIHPD